MGRGAKDGAHKRMKLVVLARPVNRRGDDGGTGLGLLLAKAFLFLVDTLKARLDFRLGCRHPAREVSRR